LALLSDIKNDLKQAMLDKNDLVRDTIRMFLSEVQRFEIDNKEEDQCPSCRGILI